MIWRMFNRCTALAYGDVCPGLLGLRALAAMASDDTAGARVLQVRGASVAGAWVATDDGSGDRGPILWRPFFAASLQWPPPRILAGFQRARARWPPEASSATPRAVVAYGTVAQFHAGMLVPQS